MTYTIVTGAHPVHPGACIAQSYLNSTPQSHIHHSSPHHSSLHHSHLMPPFQQPIPVQGQYGIPYWRPPGVFY